MAREQWVQKVADLPCAMGGLGADGSTTDEQAEWRSGWWSATDEQAKSGWLPWTDGHAEWRSGCWQSWDSRAAVEGHAGWRAGCWQSWDDEDTDKEQIRLEGDRDREVAACQLEAAATDRAKKALADALARAEDAEAKQAAAEDREKHALARAEAAEKDLAVERVAKAEGEAENAHGAAQKAHTLAPLVAADEGLTDATIAEGLPLAQRKVIDLSDCSACWPVEDWPDELEELEAQTKAKEEAKEEAKVEEAKEEAQAKSGHIAIDPYIAEYRPPDDRNSCRLRILSGVGTDQTPVFDGREIPVGARLKVLSLEVFPENLVKVQVPGLDGEFLVSGSQLLWHTSEPGWRWKLLTDEEWYAKSNVVSIRFRDCSIFVQHSGHHQIPDKQGHREATVGQLSPILSKYPNGIRNAQGDVLLDVDAYTYVALWLYGKVHITLLYGIVLPSQRLTEVKDMLTELFNKYIRLSPSQRPEQLTRTRKTRSPTDTGNLGCAWGSENLDHSYQLSDLGGLSERQVKAGLDDYTIRLHHWKLKKDTLAPTDVKDRNVKQDWLAF